MMDEKKVKYSHANCPECGESKLIMSINFVNIFKFDTYFIEAVCGSCGRIHRTGGY